MDKCLGNNNPLGYSPLPDKLKSLVWCSSPPRGLDRHLNQDMLMAWSSREFPWKPTRPNNTWTSAPRRVRTVDYALKMDPVLKETWLFRIFFWLGGMMQNYPVMLWGLFFINHERRIPSLKQPVFLWKVGWFSSWLICSRINSESQEDVPDDESFKQKLAAEQWVSEIFLVVMYCMYCIQYWFEVSRWLICCKCYSWWKRSCTTCSTWNPMKNGRFSTSTGARRISGPSTVFALLEKIGGFPSEMSNENKTWLFSCLG